MLPLLLPPHPSLCEGGLVAVRTNSFSSCGRRRTAGWVFGVLVCLLGCLPSFVLTASAQASSVLPVSTEAADGRPLGLAAPLPFSETEWVVGVCLLIFLLVLLGIGILAYRFWARVHRQREDRLNDLVQERTEQLRAEKKTVLQQAQALRDLDNAKSRVFANISHEFRTPLTLTIGPLDDLAEGLYGPLPGPVVEQIQMARRNAGRVLDLINQLLDVALLESGDIRLQARPINLHAFLDASLHDLAALAERKAITLTTPSDQPKEPLVVWANPEQLRTILGNLLSNAVKFTPEGGRVRVGLRLEKGEARISVRDSGPGISPQDLPHVFDRFYRTDVKRLDAAGGTGIGLALTKELVDLHRGTLRVESEEGFGSQFTLALPLGMGHLHAGEIDETMAPVDTLPERFQQALSLDLVPASTGAAEAARANAEPDMSSGRDASGTKHMDMQQIGAQNAEGKPDVDPDTLPEPVPDVVFEADDPVLLLVEDDAGMRTYVRSHLCDDFRVIEAVNGRDALEMARTTLPDLVLSDVMMPEMDGFDLCRALKEDPKTSFIPVILLTARADLSDRIDGLNEGADDYLTKPFAVKELRARIANLIRSRRQLREQFRGQPGTLRPDAIEVTSADAEFLETVRQAIEAGMHDENLTVGTLADAVGISRVHLYRRLKELLDQSPSALVRSIRLERAAQLLAQESGSVSEVAYGVGFKSVSHFSRVFREKHGHVPSEHPPNPSDPDESTRE